MSSVNNLVVVDDNRNPQQEISGLWITLNQPFFYQQTYHS